MYFAYMYEYRIIKAPEIVLRRRRKEMKKNDGGVNIIKIHCKHICKCHNVFPAIQLIYGNKNVKRKLHGIDHPNSAHP
jgi:hypothetical protein